MPNEPVPMSTGRRAARPYVRWRPEWDDELRAGWLTTGRSFAAWSKHFGVSVEAVRSHARKLGLMDYLDRVESGAAQRCGPGANPDVKSGFEAEAMEPGPNAAARSEGSVP